MRHLSARASTVLSLASLGFLAACPGTPPGTLLSDGGYEYFNGGGTGGNGGGAGGDPSDAGTDGLPCEVVDLLSTSCWSCHGTAGPNQRFTSRADLLAPSLLDPSKSNAKRMAERIAAKTMPPSGVAAPPAADVTALDAWVNAGTPVGSCAVSAPDAGPNPFDLPPTCTVMRNWVNGNQGSRDMNPGLACNTCHQSVGEAVFVAAGTVYETGHEPDLCFGVAASKGVTTVELTDSANHVYTTTVRSSGNFQFAFRDVPGYVGPYTARVLRGGRERRMIGPQSNGDCNSCHTQSGASNAPGRIAAP
jgi:hypothetical protein